MREIFSDDDCQGVLFVDATNAFNSLNRTASLYNIQKICPEFATYLINTYREPSKLFISNSGGKYILSSEGTTQGDNCASGFYSIGVHPIIKKLHAIDKTKQIWYADDAGAGGDLLSLKHWWNTLLAHGPMFGYFPNATKTWLVVKPQFIDQAKELFKDTGVQITMEGQKYLGAAIGSPQFMESYITSKVTKWVTEIEELCTIAEVEPQLAYSAYMFGISKRWLYYMRTNPNISEAFHPLENVIAGKFIPCLFQRNISNLERRIFSLPAKYGGLGIFNPSNISQAEYNYSISVTQPLVDVVYKQRMSIITPTLTTSGDNLEYEITEGAISSMIKERKNLVKDSKLNTHKDKLDDLYYHMCPTMKHMVQLANEKGASSWLTANLPSTC